MSIAQLASMTRNTGRTGWPMHALQHEGLASLQALHRDWPSSWAICELRKPGGRRAGPAAHTVADSPPSTHKHERSSCCT
jgi:hypothetical protein